MSLTRFQAEAICDAAPEGKILMSNKFRSLLPSLFRYTNPPANTPAIDTIDKTLILLAKEDHIKVHHTIKTIGQGLITSLVIP